MYVSLDALAWSLTRLEQVHPFFGISFLAFKSLRLPIGEMTRVPIAQEEKRILDTYYSPAPNFNGYFIPFRASGRKSRWVNSRYPDTTLQRIRTDTFGDALLHDRNTANWGWAKDYVFHLMEKMRSGTSSTIPLSALAAWIYRAVDFDSDVTTETLEQQLLADFEIDHAERILLDFTQPPDMEMSSASAAHWRDLRPLLGTPPGVPPDEGGTLGHLAIQGVGPAAKLEMYPGERLNVITGDNGFGKSFLLECAWWALTGEWVDARPARPTSDDVSEATISYTIGGTEYPGETVTTAYDWPHHRWRSQADRSVLPGLVLFARADGSFALWDQSRRASGGSSHEYVHLTREETWDGKQVRSADGRTLAVSEGLLRDWTTWQHAGEGVEFVALDSVLKGLSPPEFDPPLQVGRPLTLPDDVRLIPTLRHPYGDVPVTYSSAGISRIVSLAYLLVWSWSTHVRFSRTARREPQDRIIIFIDEIEAHLHPKWQRSIVPALLAAIKVLSHDVQVQMFVATHSPLVLASIESDFDEDRDKLFNMDLCGSRTVCLSEVEFAKYGDVDSWLRSELFGLKQARSIDAENAIERAKTLQRGGAVTTVDVELVQKDLERVLGAHDEFWPRWRHFAHLHGVGA